ncbi:hypothetical protein NMY22_g19837 [Coprinellus aureogranulatus]|nr:hypothetical protein NMY22_g19837 [Coprinellus aureogranulatus]
MVKYVTATTILIESAAPLAIVGVIAAIITARGEDEVLTMATMCLWISLSVLCPQLIIFRVAAGRAYTTGDLGMTSAPELVSQPIQFAGSGDSVSAVDHLWPGNGNSLTARFLPPTAAEDLKKLLPWIMMPCILATTAQPGDQQALTDLDVRDPAELDPDFSSDVAVFKVENTIFRVFQHEIAAASPVFRSMFAHPKGVGGQATGAKADGAPIVLEGRRAADFKALLRVLYPTSRDLIQGGVTLDKNQWIGVLGLSTIWEMREIRQFAIAKLSDERTSLTSIEKVALGRKHRIVSWFVEGLMDLWADDEITPDALEEAVGLRTAFRICAARLQLERVPQHATIVPLVVKSQVCYGFRMADLRCIECMGRIVNTTYGSCDFCAKKHIASAVGSLYVTTPVAFSEVRGVRNTCVVQASVKSFACIACHRGFATEGQVKCPSCAMSLYYICVVAGSSAENIPSPETLSSLEIMIREMFKDEIRACES